MVPKPIIVISGLGNAVGTGGATARLFASKGYLVGLLSRPRNDVEELKKSIVADGGTAEVFSLNSYDHTDIRDVFERVKRKWPDGRLKTAVWNTGQWSRIPFLDIKESDIKLSVQINIVAATAFSQEAVRAFIDPSAGESNLGGSLIMTGATSGWRGAAMFGAFAAGKHGLRALSQSIAREYGPQGVHVSYVVIDGTIITKRTLALFGDREGQPKDWLHDETKRLAPESIAKAYWYLNEQTPDCWTLEMDLRPASEKF